MKVIVAQFIFESNTFNPTLAELDLFTEGGTWLTHEQDVRKWAGNIASQTSGSVHVLEANGCSVHPVFVALCGSPAGRLSSACWARIRHDLIEALAAALPADVILLHLHGAACAEGEDDVEGCLLREVRKTLKFSGQLVVSLDLHANVTRRMLTYADAITAYRTMPHTDFVATGERAARLVLAERTASVRTMAKLSVLIPPTDTDDTDGRFAAMLHRARELELIPGIVDISLFPVQPWLDVSEMGTSVVVTGEAAPSLSAARVLAEDWYAQRKDWRTGIMPWSDIKARLVNASLTPWILVDSADATTGGSSGSSTVALEELLPLADKLPGEVLLWIVDTRVARESKDGQSEFRMGEPAVTVEAEIIYRGVGHYRARGRSYTGQAFSMGDAVVLKKGKLRIVVSAAPTFGSDPAFYECVGLHPDRALAVQAKSLVGWRAGFGATLQRGLVFDGPGTTSLNFARLPFGAQNRRLFPITAEPAHPISLWQSS